MIQITAELSTLNKAQRESVAAFIINYPSLAPEDEEEDDEQTVIPGFTVVEEDADEITTSPEQAFAGPALVVPESADTTPRNNTTLFPPAASPTSLDKAGLPWDERIHASSRSLTADGCWRKKRGVTDALVAEVESQLRSLMAIPAPPAVSEVQAGQITANTVPAPPAATADGKPAFVALISKASAAILAKQITQDQVNAAVVACGVPSLPLLANRLDLVPQVAATIDTLIAATA